MNKGDLYHKENPQVYDAFKKFTFQAINSGKKHLGSKMVFERIRWFTSVEARSDCFKLNNNYHAYYARKFMQEYPAYKDFFRTRKSQYDNPMNAIPSESMAELFVKGISNLFKKDRDKTSPS